ncbi:MAG TPA: di-heme oxidoredictase family protein [Polyangiaceae bacterium]|nr:di-heme oxidoredictase family protein [Polyangiaceae bacterium]
MSLRFLGRLSFDGATVPGLRTARQVLVGALLAGLALACSSVQAPPLEDSERLPGGDTTNELMLGSSAFKMVAPNASSEHEAMFYTGNSFFNSAWVEAPASTTVRDGLGPIFNARSCSACHMQDGRGAPPEADQDPIGLLLRIGDGELGEHGEPRGDERYGGQLQPFALPDVPAEARVRVTYEERKGKLPDGEEYVLLVPSYVLDEPAYGPLPEGLRVSPRVAPAMIGLGLLEAIPEADVLALEDAEDRDGDGISGRANRVYDSVADGRALGRFGWKAEQPNIAQQVAGAFAEDMGITNPLVGHDGCSLVELECGEAPNGGEPEIDDELFGKVVTYSRLLAVPVRERWKGEAILAGRELFHQTGCANCHVPKHHTGDSDLSELADQDIYPYTDLLLHDLGDDLGDQRPAFDASGNEWRTPPLWGVGRIHDVNGHDLLLHDGRARGVQEAILWHGGEAEGSRERFENLSRDERKSLVDFVESL